jgi:small subunit ribosomal protein S17
MPGARKSLTGTVVSDKMDKTVIVVVETTARHRLYHKILRRSKRYLAHDDRLGAKVGDLVRIMETRPLSRHKRWRVAEIIARGEVPEIEAREIDTQYLTIQREREAPPPPQTADGGADAEAPEAHAPADAPPPTAQAPSEEEPAASQAPPGGDPVETGTPPDEEPAQAETAPEEEPEQP